MRIGLLSDTHIPWEEKRLPQQVAKIFQGVSLILHAGDIYAHSVLDDLEAIAPVLAAMGDDDYPGPDPRIRQRHVLQLEGQTLWLLHERWPASASPLQWASWWQNSRPAEDEPVSLPDVVVFGHEHRTVVERTDNILYVNPGSPTYLHYRRGPGTVGILELADGKAEVSIIHL